MTSEKTPATGALEVSVVISVRNRSQLLTDCMRGLASQTLARERFEVVLIDNCSTEDLSPVIERARSEFGLDLRTARTAVDKGPAPARNIGVSMARGVVIAFTDSDCRPPPEWLASGLAPFADPAVAIVSGPIRAKPEQTATPTTKLTFMTEVEHPTFPTANLFIRRAVFAAHGGFDASLSFRDPFDRATECADTDLAWRIIKAGHARRFAPGAVMFHELEHLGAWMWILEGSRLFILPELVRRHPELRRLLLTGNVVFYPPVVLIYASAVILPLALWLQPWALLALPVMLLARGVQRTGSLSPVRLARFCGRVLLHMPRMLVMSAALIYGSIRFRSLVL